MRSVLDDYLPGYARERYWGPRRRVSDRDFPEVVARVQAAKRLPYRERGRAMQSIADDFGITMRTLERAYYGDFRTVEVAGWRATFRITADGRPCQCTSWEPIA